MQYPVGTESRYTRYRSLLPDFTAMAHPSDVLKTGDIALGRFAGTKMVTSTHREIGNRIVGAVLPAHPLLVLDVDKQKREATVMLLGTEREGNAATQLGFNKKEQELAKLERQTVFKPQHVSVMPLEKLYPNQGGHVSEETMQRVHKEMSRAVRDKTITITHLARDGTVSLYDVARERPGRVIMEAPPRGTANVYEGGRSRPPTQVYRAESAARDTSVVREEEFARPERLKPRAESSFVKAESTAGRAAETVAREATSARRVEEVVEVARDVGRFVAKEGVKALGGGPIGDAMAAADVAMAGFGFIDKHTGYAISQGPIGKSVEYVGEHTGAFKAAHVVAEKAQPYIDQAHRIADPVVDRVSNTAGMIADKTGLTAATHHVEHAAGVAAGAALDWSAQQIAHVQKGFSELTRAAGFDTPPLTHEEARAVAHGMANAKPGEAVALHHSGSMELLSANANHVPAQPGTLILDAQSFKEQMGLSVPTRNVVQVAQVAPPAPGREMMH